MFLILSVAMLYGCVTYPASSGYVVTRSGERIEFKDARIGWDSDAHFFEVRGNGVQKTIPKDDVKELCFKRDLSQ